MKFIKYAVLVVVVILAYFAFEFFFNKGEVYTPNQTPLPEPTPVQELDNLGKG